MLVQWQQTFVPASAGESEKLRRKRGWTQVYMATHTGLGSVYISQLEHGKKEPGLRTIEILALSFDMTPAQLLRRITEAPRAANKLKQ